MLLLILLAAAAFDCHGSPHNSSCLGVDPYIVDPYIVGGEEISIDKTPYQLVLEIGESIYCGASIIGEHWALTAAHCVWVGRPDIFKIRSGSSLMREGGELHQVVEVIIHEKSNAPSLDYDVALMRVDKPFNREDAIGLAKARPPTGTIATVSGWGHIRENGPASQHLRWVQVPLVDQEKCEAVNAVSIQISDRMLCAGFPEGGKDACQGDSGGPLVVGNVQVGIVSHGKGCARPSFGVYTDVAKVRSWIVEKTRV